MVKTIKFLTDDLAPVLSFMGALVPQRATMAVLSCIRIVTKKRKDGSNIVEFMSSDSETWLKMFYPCETCDEGISICVEAKSLLTALRNLGGKEVVMSVDDEKNTLFCKYDNGHFMLPYESSDTFPLPTLKGEFTTIDIPTERLRDAIGKTECAVSTDELHIVMCGIRFEFTDKGMVSVATDGRKLVKRTDTTVNSGYMTDMCFTLPQKPSKTLSSVLGSISDEKLSVKFNESTIAVWCDSFALVARLVDGRYPNYNSVIPTDNDKFATVKKADFLAAVRRVSVMGNASVELIVLKMHDNVLTIETEDLDFSRAAEETIPCEYNGEPFKIGFKSSMLMALLQNVDGEEVVLSFKAASRACIITPKNKDGAVEYISLVMPLLVQ